MAIYVSVVIVTTRKRFLGPVIQRKLGVTDSRVRVRVRVRYVS